MKGTLKLDDNFDLKLDENGHLSTECDKGKTAIKLALFSNAMSSSNQNGYWNKDIILSELYFYYQNAIITDYNNTKISNAILKVLDQCVEKGYIKEYSNVTVYEDGFIINYDYEGDVCQIKEN